MAGELDKRGPLSLDTGRIRSPWTGDETEEGIVRLSPVEDLSLPFSPPPRRATVEKPPSIPWPTKQASVTSVTSLISDLDIPDYPGSSLPASRTNSRDLLETTPLRSESMQSIQASASRDVLPPRRGSSHAESPKVASRRFSWESDREPSSTTDERPNSAGFSGRMRSLRSTAKRLSLVPREQTIPENDEIDMGLLGHVAKVGTGGRGYKALEDEHEQDDNLEHGVDISTFTGPMVPMTRSSTHHYSPVERSESMHSDFNVQSPSGQTISSKKLYQDAYNSPTSTTRSFKRNSFSLSRKPSTLNRAPTIRDLGQNEANKRNEVVRVVMDEEHDGPTNIDISTFAGESGEIGFNQSRKSTMIDSRVEVFYPQHNWKPITMRWPYLVTLIILSIVLAICQELLYQKSKHKPLYSFVSAQDLNTWSFFSFKYLPTMVAVSFGILWQLTDFEVKRLEVYYQLSKPGGALAAESINVDYLTFINFLRPFRAIRYKHYAVALCSVASLFAVSLVPTLQTASVVLEPDRNVRNSDPSVLKEIRIDRTWSRFLTVVLALIAAMGCALLWQIQQRRSGLTADVKGVAGIAAMANRSHILMDFQNLDTANPDAIHQKLKSRRYVLQNSSLAPLEGVAVSREDQDKYDQYRMSDNPHPLMLRLSTGIPFVISMFLFALFIPVVLFTNADIIPDKAPWLLTALAICIKLGFTTLENDVRMIEPFYKLWCRHQPPNVLTLDYTGMPFAWMPTRALINGDYLLAVVGFGSVLAEILTVCVTSFSGVAGVSFVGVPATDPVSSGGGTTKSDRRLLLARVASADSGEETFNSFWISFALAIIIMVYLCLTATLVYLRRRHPFLPRQPNTVASVLAYIHQSNMLLDFVGTEKLDNDEMVRRLARIGKQYGLGWFTGRDGKTHCGIDQEELANDYKHGADVRAASTPWNQRWDTY